MQTSNIIRSLYMKCCRILLGPWLSREYAEKTLSMNERPIEYGFALKHIILLCPKSILDVGPGRSSWPHLLKLSGVMVDAIDKVEGYWTEGVFNRHYLIRKEDITEPPRNNVKYDMITCISTLEHIVNYEGALKGMFDRLEEGGHIVLTAPYNEKEYFRNIYETEGAGHGQDYPYVCQVFNRKSLEKPIERFGGDVVDREFYKTYSGKYFTHGERIYPPEKVDPNRAQLACLLISKRN